MLILNSNNKAKTKVIIIVKTKQNWKLYLFSTQNNFPVLLLRLFDIDSVDPLKSKLLFKQRFFAQVGNAI